MSTLPSPRQHGGDGPRIARALGLEPSEILDLSQSLNPVAADPRPVVAAHLDALASYPDPQFALESLAAAMRVDTKGLLLTNGGSEAISLVAGVVGGFVVEPEFALHPRGTGRLWRSNPHSPSGMLAPTSDRVAVWDEAFYPLATGRWTRGDEDTIVVGSLTKLLACPGLRIGYILAEPEFVEVCRLRQPEWSLNSLACASLPDLLAPLDLQRDFEAVQSLRSELRMVLESHGLTSPPSDANWLLVECPGLREALAPHGIVVRDCSSFGLAGTSRIAVPNGSGLTRLDEALHQLRDWLARLHIERRSDEPTKGSR